MLGRIQQKEIALEPVRATIDQDKCSGCRICNDLCPYNAILFHEDRAVSEVNPALCQGCGTCIAACPAGAITGTGFSDEQILAQLDGLLLLKPGARAGLTLGTHASSFIGDRLCLTNKPFEPVIIGFTCNWCSYRAADLAGIARIKYPPNVRLIRLMCSGRLDPTFVLKALAGGADGVLITGLSPGRMPLPGAEL